MNTLLKCVNVKKKQNIETPAATRTVPIQRKKKKRSRIPIPKLYYVINLIILERMLNTRFSWNCDF